MAFIFVLYVTMRFLLMRFVLTFQYEFSTRTPKKHPIRTMYLLYMMLWLDFFRVPKSYSKVFWPSVMVITHTKYEPDNRLQLNNSFNVWQTYTLYWCFQELIQTFCDDLKLSSDVVTEVLESLRLHAVQKLQERNKFQESGLATIKIKISGHKEKVSCYKFECMVLTRRFCRKTLGLDIRESEWNTLRSVTTMIAGIFLTWHLQLWPWLYISLQYTGGPSWL